MNYLKQFLIRHKGKTALAVLLLLGQVVGTLLIPALVADIVDHGIPPGRHGRGPPNRGVDAGRHHFVHGHCGVGKLDHQ